VSEQNLITCSHCRSDIPRGANVCKGCRAEIKYGTPGLFLLLGLLLPVGAGLYVAKFLATSLGFNETVSHIAWGGITLAGWYMAYRVCNACFSDYVSFTRQKNK